MPAWETGEVYAEKRMFDEKVKPFEKLTGIQKDTVRLAWFVTGANLRSVVRGGNLVSHVDLNATSDLPCHVNDVWANVDELEQYFEADAWNRLTEWRESVSDDNWPCCACHTVKLSTL